MRNRALEGLSDRAGCAARLASVMLILLGADGALAGDCGVAGTLKGKDGAVLATRVFDDGSIAVRAPLAVNPDGSAASYTVGDHGYTYIANGLAAWTDGRRRPCDAGCMARFKAAEAAGFAAGTAEFCVFAMEVAPPEGGRLEKCTGGHVVGNGKGSLVRGEPIESLDDEKAVPYRSMTTLRHPVEGKASYLDASRVPVAVAPGKDLIGRVVWVGGRDLHGTYAVIGDIGPAFGEGSIALHQLLTYGELKSQPPGPIPVARRCTAVETDLPRPFLSRPAGGSKDRCRAGRAATTPSDVRAYVGIDAPLDFVILGRAGFKPKGGLVSRELTVESIAALAADAGYSPEKVAAMRECLPATRAQ